MVETAFRKGDVCFLKLDGFSPAWRQAVVVHTNLRGAQLFLACRVLNSEIENLDAKVTVFDLKESLFMLVEGKPRQTRRSFTGTNRALEVDPQLIVDGAKAILESADLHYFTASEDLEEQPALGAAKTPKLDLEPDESASESEEEADEVMSLLMKAQKLEREKGISSASVRGARGEKVSRYPMLDKKKEEKDPSALGLDRLLSQAVASGSNRLPVGDVNLNALISLEILKTLRKGKQSKSGTLGTTGEDSLGETSDSSVETSQNKARGAGRALKDFRAGHKKMKQKPLKHVKRYIKEIEEIMGVGPETAYNVSDFTKKVQWGKQKGLMRTHFAVSEMLQTMLRGNHDLAALQAVQILRALYQCNLDGGSWKAASLLMSHPDPLDRVRFGGEPSQLEDIASYLKVMQELERRSTNLADRSEEESGKGKKGKGKKADSQSEG